MRHRLRDVSRSLSRKDIAYRDTVVKVAMTCRSVLAGAVTILLSISSLHAQWGGWRRVPPRFPDEATIGDSRFIFTRVLYESVRREQGGQGWFTDYPDADRNFMQRFDELTTASVSMDSKGEPNHVVVRLTDDEIFSFPFLFMSDVGTLGFTAAEASRLREYLLKGGFLYVDDFWGSYAWEHWERELRKVLPAGEYPIFDVPLDHTMLHMLYDIDTIPQIPSIHEQLQPCDSSPKLAPV